MEAYLNTAANELEALSDMAGGFLLGRQRRLVRSNRLAFTRSNRLMMYEELKDMLMLEAEREHFRVSLDICRGKVLYYWVFFFGFFLVLEVKGCLLGD